MNTIFNDVCVLVAAAFALTLVPSFRQPERSFLSRRDQGAALLVFTILGLIEEATVSHAGLLNERIVAVCVAGLVAGPWVGLAVGVFVTWLAVAHHGLPLGSIATSMLRGGLVGGLLYRWRPKLAQHPITGFCLTLAVTLLRSGLISLCAPDSRAALSRLPVRSLLSRRDQGTALLVFMSLGLLEEATAFHAGWLNERIVAVCAAGLVAGPWVGLAVSLFVTWLAVAHHGLPLGSIGLSMLLGGLAGGLLYRWRSKLAQHPLTGFCLTLGVSLLRSGLIFFFAPHPP